MRAEVQTHRRPAASNSLSFLPQIDSFSLHPSASTLILNGDLTAYFHLDELSDYESYFHEQLPSNIKRYYPSLGNHDYKNNIDDTSFFGDEWTPIPSVNTGCNAQHAMQYMRCGVARSSIPG